MMTTTLMRSTVVTSFRPVAFHAMSSGNNGWSLDVRLRAVSGCRSGWQVVCRRALAFVGGSVYGAGDVWCADWRATMTLGDVGCSRDGRRSCSGGDKVRRQRDGGRGRRDIQVGTTPVRRKSTVKYQEPFLLSTGGRYHSS